MAADNIAPNTPMPGATGLRYGGEQEEALRLFDSMGDSGYDIRKDSGCYNAAIWACEQTNNFQRSVQLLRLMKMEGFKRSTTSFDGVLSALFHAEITNSAMKFSNGWQEIGLPCRNHL